MKGVIITSEKLIIIISGGVFLAATFIFFMGTFSPGLDIYRQKQDFNSLCVSWARTNCKGDEIPYELCCSYSSIEKKDFSKFDCSDKDNIRKVARACGCVEPFGMG